MEGQVTTIPPSIEILYESFLYFELLLHVVGYVVSTSFMIVFSNLRSVHIDLLWILNSFLFSFCVTSVLRVYYCLVILIAVDVESFHSSLTLTANMRDVATYVGGLHLLLIAGERLLATARSKTYEDEQYLAQIGIAVFFLWTFSYFVITTMKGGVISNFLAAVLFMIIFIVSIGLLVYVRRTNLRSWKRNRGTMPFSHNYQVHENVTSARYLYKCIVIFAVQTTIAWISLVIYLVFR
ncbi:hypothetical protein GCK32_013709 [Trichostrongylus colubriformis]|uniref:Uncharacterized protein n=1 Tax=Trichostrongylus colubriformis TaxID=6319 RepID=A0AAN8FBM5_TRICO